MFKRSRSEASRREQEGLVSWVLLHGRDLPETRLTVTWIEVAPGGRGSVRTATPRSRSTPS